MKKAKNNDYLLIFCLFIFSDDFELKMYKTKKINASFQTVSDGFKDLRIWQMKLYGMIMFRKKQILSDASLNYN